jgi:hypothetical protein
MKIKNGYRGDKDAALDEALGAYPISKDIADSIRRKWGDWLSDTPKNNGKEHKNEFRIHEQPGAEFWNLTFSRIAFEGSMDASNFLGRQESGFTVYRNSIHKMGKY